MDKYYSVLQAAEALGKSRPTVYKMIRDGKLRLRRFAGKSAIAITDIERLMRRYCPNCRASITDTDVEAGACTQCGAEVKG